MVLSSKWLPRLVKNVPVMQKILELWVDPVSKDSSWGEGNGDPLIFLFVNTDSVTGTHSLEFNFKWRTMFCFLDYNVKQI